MLYCRKCGQANQDGAQVCLLCASELTDGQQSENPVSEPKNAVAKKSSTALYLLLNICCCVLFACNIYPALLALDGAIFAGIARSAGKKGQIDKEETLCTVSKVLLFTAIGLFVLQMLLSFGVVLLLTTFTTEFTTGFEEIVTGLY